jgi:hypothetical protein
MTRPGLQEIGLDTLVHEVAASGQNEAYERSALCVCVFGSFLRDDGEVWVCRGSMCCGEGTEGSRSSSCQSGRNRKRRHGSPSTPNCHGYNPHE